MVHKFSIFASHLIQICALHASCLRREARQCLTLDSWTWFSRELQKDQPGTLRG